MPRIVIAEDDAPTRFFLSTALRNAGYTVDEASNGEEALGLCVEESCDLVLSDIRMPRMGGLALRQALIRAGVRAPFILMTAHESVDTAVQALRSGCTDYLAKPLAPKELLLAVRTVLAGAPAPGDRAAAIVGDSSAIACVRGQARTVAASKATVLIQGETGTGKELVAGLVHAAGPRAERPFVRVNCAALAESLLESEIFGHERGAFTGAAERRKGRFELADGGTLLLDEISEIAPPLQAKLLRVLEEEEFERVGGTQTVRVDVRVIGTTNRDLAAAVQDGTFRSDLFFRLNVVPIRVPPLRERKEDIAVLVEHFAARYCAEVERPCLTLSEDARALLEAYDWPGNVREIENLVRRAAAMEPGESIAAGFVRNALLAGGQVGAPAEADAPLTLAEAERRLILRALSASDGNREQAAQQLGVTSRTLFNKLKRYRESDLVQTQT
jgi:DNA-binding NtrC family response regulator